MGFTTIEDAKVKQTKRNQNTWTARGAAAGRGAQRGRGQQQRAVQGELKAKSKKDISRQNYYLSNQVKQLRCNLRDNAIDVKPEWELITEFTKQTFDRVPTLKPVLMGTVRECGEIHLFDNSWDKATPKKPKALKVFEGKTFEESLFDDPIMVELIEQDKADIFTTDVIASALMCATKSNWSWDIEIKKFGDKIFIDKRSNDEDEEVINKENLNILDFETVNESALENQPMDDQTMNGIWPLMKEAKALNNSFLSACQSPDVTQTVNLDEENPFIEDENQIATRVGYKYKIWKIQEADEATGKKEMRICIRCTVHCHNGRSADGGETRQTMNVYSFNEYNPAITTWRNDIDTHLIPCMNTEIKNNSYKVSRWLCQSILADVDLMKFAFISRKNMEDNKKHVVLTTHTV